MTASTSIRRAATGKDSAALVRRFQATNDRRVHRDLFDELYREHGARLYGFCLKRLLPDRDAAQDALQETFLTAWANLKDLKRPEALEPWLYEIARRRCAEQWRKKDRAARPLGTPLERWEETAGRETAHRLRQIVADDTDFTARRSRALALVRNIAAAQGPVRQRFHELYAGEELTGDVLAQRLGLASGNTKDHLEALQKAFKSNVLAKDPRNRDACGGLNRLLNDAVTSRKAAALAAEAKGDHAAAERHRRQAAALERFLAVPASTEALPHSVCGSVTRHTGTCRTCKGNGRRSVARWFPAAVPFTFADLLAHVARDRFDLVAASPPADGGPATEAKSSSAPQSGWYARRSGRKAERNRVPAACAGSRDRQGGPPGIGRRITVNTLVALALGVAYGNSGTDLPMTRLPWSSTAPSGEPHGHSPEPGGGSARHTGPGQAGPAPAPNGSAATAPAPGPAPETQKAASPSAGPPGNARSSASAPAPAGTSPSTPQTPSPEQPPKEKVTQPFEQSPAGDGTRVGPSESQAPTGGPPTDGSSGTGPFVNRPGHFQDFVVRPTAPSDEPG
ncbi:RNA polymerase sigma factor [Streptomyces chrestomyceticus]|uniref:RNA polymerase sigma factor n=1 Tax=Streptomyces chrestomyceticus TaxID=68185 RepID=UPI0033CB4E2C